MNQLRIDLDAGLRNLSGRVDWLGRRVDALELRERWHQNELQDLKSRIAIEAVSRWVRQAQLNMNPMISVITPTKDRPQHLERAIQSVRAQRYQNWELIVVDDGTRFDSRPLVEAAGDKRIVWARNPRRGSCAARNHALSLATGDLVAYLDDDNTMDPDWLYAIAWAFEQRPEIDLVYGAHVVDDHLRLRGGGFGATPWTFFAEWSRDRLKEVNLADTSAIAHRAGISGAWFDESVEAAADWDLMLRLTADKDPLALPIVAAYYTTDAPDRNSAGPMFDRNFAEMAARARRA